MNIVLLSGNAPLIGWSFSSETLPARLSLSRASTGARFNLEGTAEMLPANMPRFDYDPVSHAARGILIEPQRTNLLRNNSMTGASAPSTLPTYWGWSGSTAGINRSIVGTGTEYGMPYIDLRWAGTATAASNNVVSFEASSTFLAASIGDTFTHSFYYKLVAGSLSGVSAIQNRIQENNSSGGYLLSSSVSIPPTSALQRSSLTKTMANASVAYTNPLIVVQFTLSVAVDFTLRVYAPQFEKAANASSVVLTSGSTATRAADALSFTIPNGVSKLKYTFDDNATQTVTGLSAGDYTVPTTLNRAWIKSIQSL